jgi:hypothetical protein
LKKLRVEPPTSKDVLAASIQQDLVYLPTKQLTF